MYRRMLYLCVMCAVIATGCSHDSINAGLSPDIPEIASMKRETVSSHTIWGIWDMSLDPETGNVAVVPSRSLPAHFDVTDYLLPPECDDCIGIFIEGFEASTYTYDIRVTLKNPTPLSAYDVRGILLIGNPSDNRALVNPDEFTEMYDDSIPPDRNPFKVFAKGAPFYQFAPDQLHEVLYRISIPPPQNFNVKYAVDASWPGNQKEPYSIFEQDAAGEIYDLVPGEAHIVAYVADWQDDVEWVRLDTTPLGSPGKLALNHIEDCLWEGLLSNEWSAPAGDYELWLEAKSEGNSQILYDLLPVTVLPYINQPPVWFNDIVGITSATPGYGFVSVGYGTAIDPDEPVTYNIYCSSATPIDFETVIPENDEDGSPYTVEGLEYDQEYYFAVRAMDGLGLEEKNTVELMAVPHAQEEGWGKVWGILEYSDVVPRCISAVISTDIYVTGIFNDETDFDPGPGTDIHDSTGNSYDSFLCKYTSAGDYQWVNIWSGLVNEPPEDMTQDSQGNIYIVGSFDGDVDFDPGEDEDIWSPDSWSDAYITKYNSDDEYEWARGWGGFMADEALSVAVDSAGDIYATGVYADTVDFDPGPGVENRSSIDYSDDVFLCKYNSAGDFLWVRTWGSESSDKGTALAVNGAGNILVGGEFHSTADFDPGTPEIERTAGGWIDAFMSEFTPEGGFVDVRTWGGDDKIYDVVYLKDIFQDSAANTIVSGTFYGSVDFDPGTGIDEKSNGESYGSPFISKYGPSDNYSWTQIWINDSALIYNNLSADENQDLYMAGSFQWTIDFDPGDGVEERTADLECDAYLLKLTQSGDFCWVRHWSSEHETSATAVTVSESNIYVIGSFRGTIDLDPGPGLSEYTTDGSGNRYAFLIKLLPNGYWE